MIAAGPLPFEAVTGSPVVLHRGANPRIMQQASQASPAQAMDVDSEAVGGRIA